MPDTDEQTTADEAYEWAVRALYAALIVANLLVAWEAWKDTPSGLEARAKIRARLARLRACAGCEARKQWLHDRAHMLWQATEIVEEAREHGMG
jgi:hypothetical protein